MFKPFSVQKGLRIIPAVLNGTSGTPAFGEGKHHLTVVDTGVGIYTVSFVNPCVRAPIVMVTSAELAKIASIESVTITGFVVKLLDATDGATAVDGNVHIAVFALDASDEV